MTNDRGNTRRVLASAAAVILLAAGAAGMHFYMGGSMSLMHHEPATAMPASAPAPAPREPAAAGVAKSADGPLPDVTITLTDEAVRRAGIKTVNIGRGSVAGSLRLPGVVEPNAYQQAVVTPVIAGRLTSVSAALGDRVSSGQTLAQIYSSELSDAQTSYLTMIAEFEAAHQRLLRTERVVEIGAASAQELETVRVEHTTHSTMVEGARTRLLRLGLTPERIAQLKTAEDVTATVAVLAPLTGVVTERAANVGVNVDPSTALFKIVDLANVWVVADLYERDFATVKVGSTVTVTTAAYPGLALQGRVSYVDPRMSPDTRTAKVRVEVGNRAQQLRLGMYADVVVATAGASEVLTVPRTAVQTVGDRQVVYLADPKKPGAFVEREVRLGEAVGPDVQIISGATSSDLVVVDGSFSLRAERERLGLRAGSTTTPR